MYCNVLGKLAGLNPTAGHRSRHGRKESSVYLVKQAKVKTRQISHTKKQIQLGEFRQSEVQESGKPGQTGRSGQTGVMTAGELAKHSRPSGEEQVKAD